MYARSEINNDLLKSLLSGSKYGGIFVCGSGSGSSNISSATQAQKVISLSPARSAARLDILFKRAARSHHVEVYNYCCMLIHTADCLACDFDLQFFSVKEIQSYADVS